MSEHERSNKPGVKMPGTPRSLRELGFAAGSHPCAHCGAHAELRWKYLDSDPVWLVRATCPSCGNERVHVFKYTEDLTDIDPPELELGEGPSTVLDPDDLVGVIECVEPTITTPLVSLSDETEQNWDRVERVQTALNELAKFVPAGAASIPESAFRDEVGRAHQRVHAEHYTRAWIESSIARYATLVDNVIPARSAPVVQQRGTIDRASLVAHREWVRNGSGARLDVAGGSARALKLDGSQIERGRFEGVDFTESDLNDCDWSEAELRACTFVNVKLNRAKLVGAVILDSTFDRMAAALLSTSRAKISGCSFERAGMPGSVWSDAVVSATRFAGASFGNARWERARFVDCDFRDASLEPDREVPPTRMRGAAFEGCDFRNANLKGTDLRGVTFTRCKLAGAHGEPKHFREVAVEACDVTLDELKKQLVLPMMAADAVASAPSRLVANDRDPGAEPALVVFEVGKAGARRVARTSEPATAATCGRSGVVWLAAADAFTVWSHDSQRLVITRSTNQVSTPGSTLPVEEVTRIASFIDAQYPGRRGVALITPSRPVARLVFVQEQDLVAIDDPSYTIDDARRDGRWAAVLGGELAAWLGVAHDELRTDLT